MPTVHEAIDAAITEVTDARKRVSSIKSVQVKNVDAVASLKATAQTWFYTHKPFVMAAAPVLDLAAVDQHYTTVLNSTAKHAAKKTYLDALKDAKTALVAARTAALVTPPAAPVANADDLAPDFSPLAGNPEMRDILTRRWHECAKCVKADAHLAAIVMMGGLLEALFVARANAMTDKKPLLAAKAAPDDPKTGKKMDYQKWMLESYINVGLELTWITALGKTLADTLKEYRNYVHPAKELKHGITLGLNDSSLLWPVTKGMVYQLLKSVKP
ncbi:MAG: hypothetical protein JNK25_10260 [Phycisphaerae bacterium]|nr:hypothetical protein [Phycisphaerae bacterium]